jgi:hypothetical protein
MNLSKEVFHTKYDLACYVTTKILCKRTLSILNSNKEVLHLEAGLET